MLTNMIDYLRIALYVLLIFIFVIAFQEWQKEHMSLPITTTAAPEVVGNNYVPELTNTPQASIAPVSTAQSKTILQPVSQSIVHVKTDVLDVSINPVGGNIIEVKLPKYPEALNSSVPFTLLNNSPEEKYIAQSGLLSKNGPDTSKGQAIFSTEKSDYTLENGQNELQVKLLWKNEQGLTVSKTFTFKRNSYEMDVGYDIENKSSEPWQGNLYMQLMRKNTPPPNTQGFVNLATYFGAAISSPEKPFQKISFKEVAKQEINLNIQGGWAAMIQHYFISAWVPDKNLQLRYFSRVTEDGLYVIGMMSQPLTVSPGEKSIIQSKFYAGPSIADNLKQVAPGLELTIDYGWFWFISIAIFWMMQQIYYVVGNWGWAIVFVTLIIKLIFYPLSAKSYRSMSALKKLQPRINQLKERCGEDKQKFTQGTLELYKKEKVNPMSGCLPILIQIPVFIGLYWVLIESVELRHAPFILWIHDLTTKDPYYVLPVLMGLSMFFQQRLNPPPPDPMQAKVMAFMPILFTALFLNFPAGLMLYWFVNNTLSFLQQWYIMRTVEKGEKHKKS